jgi:hypothetical protein
MLGAVPTVTVVRVVALIVASYGVTTTSASVGGMNTMHGKTRSFSSAVYRDHALNVGGTLWHGSFSPLESGSALYPKRSLDTCSHRLGHGYGRRKSHRSRAYGRRELYVDQGATFASTAKVISRPFRKSAKNKEILLGKVVALLAGLALNTPLVYVHGYASGYGSAVICGLPEFVCKSATRPTFWKELTGRAARIHQKSLQWGQSFGRISATYAGFQVAVFVLGNGRDDPWLSIVGRMAAGAYFARAGQY